MASTLLPTFLLLYFGLSVVSSVIQAGEIVVEGTLPVDTTAGAITWRSFSDYIDKTGALDSIELSFPGVRQNDTIFYKRLVFHVMMYFDSVKADVPIIARNFEFREDVMFDFANFERETDFHKLKCSGKAEFQTVNFNNLVNFSEADFFNTTRFTESTKFAGIANFEKVTSRKSLSLNGVEFDSTADFRNAKLDGTVRFTECIFNEDLLLSGAQLPDTLILSARRIRGVVDLRNVTFKENRQCFIDLTGIDIDKLKINHNMFTLLFPKGYPLESKRKVYAELLAVYKKNGLTDAYRRLSIDLDNLNAQESGFWFIKVPMYYVSKAWWCHGFKREYIVGWMLFFYFVFVWVASRSIVKLLKFGYADQAAKNVLYNENHYSKEPDSKPGKKRRFVASLFYVGFLFFGFSLEKDKFGSSAPHIVFILSIYAVGVFCITYFIAFIFAFER